MNTGEPNLSVVDFELEKKHEGESQQGRGDRPEVTLMKLTTQKFRRFYEKPRKLPNSW